MLDLLVGILHLVVFPGGLFALALGLFLYLFFVYNLPQGAWTLL